jgi:hypothetical protein
LPGKRDEEAEEFVFGMDPNMSGMEIGNWRSFGWEHEYVLMFLRAIAISLGSMSIPTICLGLKSRATQSVTCPALHPISKTSLFSNHSRQKERKRKSSQLGLR